MAPRRKPDDGTATRILDVAERLVQTRGFNGFSYADIARELDVTKAALHYHFRTKTDLGLALVERYHRQFAAALDAVTHAEPEPRIALHRYVDVYRDVLRRDRICLCGMLAAESETLPTPMRRAVADFFDLNVAWLTSTLDRGRRRGNLRFGADPAAEATSLLGALEGAMLIARLRHDRHGFDAAADRLLASYEIGA